MLLILTEGESRLNAVLLPGPGECGREARAAALSVRGMQEALHGVEKALQMHHTSCAVVGNSGGLLEHNYGKFIDNHDFVMRVNHRKLDG